MPAPFIRLSDLPKTPKIRPLARQLHRVDRNRDGRVAYRELAPLPKAVRTAAASYFSAEPDVAPPERPAPLSVDPRAPKRLPARKYERNGAVANATDALLQTVEARLHLLIEVMPGVAGSTTWALRALSRLLELAPGDRDARAEALRVLTRLRPAEVRLDDPEVMGVVKRLAMAAGLRSLDVQIDLGNRRTLPLPGFEKLLAQRRGISIAELLADPKTRALGREAMNADLDEGDQDGFLSTADLKTLPKAARAALMEVLAARVARLEEVEPERPAPISARVKTSTDDHLPKKMWPMIDALKDAPDELLSEDGVMLTLEDALRGRADHVANPYVLRAFARLVELAAARRSRGDEPFAIAERMRPRLAELLTSGFLTPMGLANAPARDSLAIVLRLAKAIGLEPEDIRVTIGGGARLSLRQVHESLGELDLVPVTRGLTQPADPPAPVGPRKPPPPWSSLPGAGRGGQSIGGAPHRVLNDAAWDALWPDLVTPYWGYYGNSARAPEVLPPASTAKARALAPAPVDRKGVGGYVNPWQLLADPRATEYLAAASRGDWRDGWLAYVSRNTR